MANRPYSQQSPPVRPGRGLSNPSISQNTFGGSPYPSASGHTPELLRGMSSMSPDATIPRTFSSPNDCSLRGNRNQDNECFSGSDPNILLSPSDGLPAPRYILHSGLNSTDTFPVTADHRLDPWTPQGRQGLAPVSIPHYQPGAKSDANSRASGADEGYYTISHHDAQSIHSMNLRNMNEEQQDMYNQQLIRSVPSNYLDPGPRTQNQDQDQSDQSTQLQPATARHVTASQQIPDAFVCEEDNCDFTGKTHSELKKHEARHKRAYICTVPQCSRFKGFATVNDLERHQKTVHGLQPEHGKSRDYKCFGMSCSKGEKKWPRFDNFKQHLRRMHRHENTEELIDLSNQWHEKEKQMAGRHDRQIPQQTAAPSSRTEVPNTPFQAGQVRLSLQQGTKRRSGGQAQVPDSSRPNPNPFSLTSETELGYQSTNAGSARSQIMHRSFSAKVPASVNVPRRGVTSVIQGHSTGNTDQGLTRSHGSQNMPSSSHMTIPSQVPSNDWSIGPTHMQSQGGFDQYVPLQKITSNLSGPRSMYQHPVSPMSMPHGSRTEPNPGIANLQDRLREFPPSAQIHQDSNFSSTYDDFDFANIGLNHVNANDGAGAPEPLFPRSDDQQHLARVEKEHGHQSLQVEVSTFSAAAIQLFIKDHESKASNGQADLTAPVMDRIIRAGILSLQGSTPNAESTDSTGAASPVDLTNFRPGEQGGKPGFFCSSPGCDKFMGRKCDLRKHATRHRKPWACTTDKCRKPFGSKNDWKRHETTQHEQRECWRCEEPLHNPSDHSFATPAQELCLRVCYTRDIYIKHLKEHDPLLDSRRLAALVSRQRIGHKSQAHYWCGFCNAIMTMKEKGTAGDDERFNHIDEHFSKEGLKIEQWLPLEGRPSARDVSAEAEDPGSDEVSSENNSEGRSEETMSLEVQAAQHAHTPQDSRKRPASVAFPGNHGRPTKAPRPESVLRDSGTRTRLINCCLCKDQFPFWSGSCANCSHRCCQSCTAETV